MAEYCTQAQVAAISLTNTLGAPELGHIATLLDAASRQVDRLCEVADNYFAKAGDTASDRTFYGNGTRHLYVGWHNSVIGAGDVEFVDTSLTVPTFTERGNYLVTETGYCWDWDKALTISAKWGFAAIPAEIQQATAELALAMWQTSDAARERAVADAGDPEFRPAKIPARVRMTCEKWKRLKPVVFA